VGWEGREGGNWHNSAAYNPLNTTQPEPGYSTFRSTGQGAANIGIYKNWQQGLKATADTLNNGRYGDILSALRSGHGLGGNLKGLGTWSGGGYTSITGDTPVASGGTQISPGTIQPSANAAQPSANIISGAKQQANNLKYIREAATNAFLNHPQDPFGALSTAITSDSNFASQVASARHAIGTTTKTPTGDQFSQVLNAAKQIAGKHYNYEWGGGHNPGATPTHGTGHGSGSGVGYDCSGALSAVLMASGDLKQPLVSGQFAEASKYIPSAKPGVGGQGDITIYANATHTFAKIGNSYFGTSAENPGGGAGFFKNAQTAGYQVWHVPLSN
jgi:hypothetical protein